MAPLQAEVEKALYLYDSGQSLELYRDVDGNVQVGIQGAIEEFAQPRTRSEMAQSPEVTSLDPMVGATGRPDPSYMLGRAELPMERQREMFEREAFQAIGAPLGLSIATLLTLPDLITIPPLVAAGMITADEGKKFENVLNMLKYVPSAQVGEFLKDQGKNLGFSDAQVEAFGQGYLGGELSSIVVNAVPGAKQLVKGAKWLKDSAADYAAGAPARVAERGTRLMSGLDPQAAVDEIIAGIRKATQTRKRNKLVNFIEKNPEGFTIDLDGTPTPAQGFVVAPLKQTEIFIEGKELTPQALDGLVDNVVALTQASGGKVYAGGWFDDETGRYVLDAVQIVDSRDDALYLAAAGDQDAIFDLGEFNVIRTEDGLTELKASNTFDGGRYDEQRANQAKLVEGFTGAGVSDAAAQATVGAARSAEEFTLGPASDAEKVNQLSPEYRVTVEGFEPEKGAGIPKAINPGNFVSSSTKLDELSTEFPDPLASPETYALMMARTNNRAEVQAPPSWLIENANNPEQFAKWFGGLTDGQIKAADEGLSIQKQFTDAYKAGAGPELTGQLMLWSILSRRLSAFPHESGFKDLAQAATPFIQKAANGEWSDADTAAWLKLVKDNIPAGSPGKSATSNANDFGKYFLAKMAKKDADGKTGLVKLHEMMADPNMSSTDLRRAFYGLAEGTGIQNKILSFALLVSGRNDVVVLDRIQINRMWGGGEKIYDDVANQFDGAQGLVHYEALERALANRVQDLYDRVGRSDQASVGRYHWESWVLSSGQVVGHPTLEGVVKTAKGAAEPVAGLPVKEGRFHQFLYGAEYEKLPDGKYRYTYRTSDGTPYEFTKAEIDSVFAEVKKKSSGVLPPDFPGVKSFEGGNIPWYEYKGVDRGKLDELIREKGKPTK